jgi:predicted nucleic acid-binding protein
MRHTCSELAAGPGQIRNTASDLVAEKVNKLHREVLDSFKDICAKAIAIGEILVRQKEALKHGEWLDWIDTQLEIGPRQVLSVRCW